MIPNLKEKLAQISAETTPQIVEQSPLNMECSEYTTSYGREYMIGDISIGETEDMDFNVLSGICMESFGNDFTKEDIVYFDTETTGLPSGVSTVAFLVGVGYYDNNEFIVKQYLMNDYHQETSMLNSLNDILLSKKAVVSFNGKSFDRHIVNSRAIMNRLIRPLEDMVHLDIMHASRRLYAKRLGSCSLVNLEEKILGVEREDDIPGALIPEIFSDYLKYNDDTMLKKVVEHNLMDIANMTAVSYKLANAYIYPESLKEKDDIFCQGRIYRKLGLVDKAKICYNTLGTNKDALIELGQITKSQKDYKLAIDIYNSLKEIDSLNINHHLELAKIYEHRTKELDKALAEVNGAILTNMSLRDLGYTDYGDNLEKRKQRILNKLSRKRKDHT